MVGKDLLKTPPDAYVLLNDASTKKKGLDTVKASMQNESLHTTKLATGLVAPREVKERSNFC